MDNISIKEFNDIYTGLRAHMMVLKRQLDEAFTKNKAQADFIEAQEHQIKTLTSMLGEKAGTVNLLYAMLAQKNKEEAAKSKKLSEAGKKGAQAANAKKVKPAKK